MARSLGTLTIDLIARIGGFTQGMDKASREAQRKAKEIDAALGKIGANIGAAAVAGATILTATLVTLGRQAIDAADQIGELSEKTGISTESLSRLGFAAKMSGSDLESLTAALPRFAKNATEAASGSKAQSEAFAAIGVSATDAEGRVKSMDSLLLEVADKFASYEDGTAKAALAQEFFGKTGAELIPFLNQGAAGIARLSDESDRLGNTISGDLAQKAGEFNDTLDRLKTLAGGFGLALAQELLPSMEAFVGDAIDATDRTKQLAEAVTSVLAPFRLFATVLVVSGETVADLAIGVAGLGEALYRLGQKDFVGAAAAIKGATDQIAANMASTDRTVQIIWGDMTARVGADSANLASNLGIQWQGIADMVIGQSQRMAAGVGTVLRTGVGTVLLPNASPTAPSQNKSAPVIPSGTTGKTGKSDAKKQADDLTSAYQSLSASLREQIDLYGEVTNVARISFDTQSGGLAALKNEQKDLLLGQAAELDRLIRQQEEMDQRREQYDQLEELTNRYADENEVIFRAMQQRQAIFDAAHADGLLLQDEYQELSLASQVEYAAGMVEIERNQAQMIAGIQQDMLSSVGDVANNLTELLRATGQEQSALGKAAFIVSKGIAVATAIINANMAATSTMAAYANLAAMSGPAAPGILAAGLAQAEVIRALGYVNAGLIAATAVASFDGGGYTGNGSRTGGLDGKGGFMAMLHPQETVIDHTRGQGGGIVVNLIEDASRAGTTEQRTDSSGRQIIDAFVADIRSDGPAARALQGTYGLPRRGR